MKRTELTSEWLSNWSPTRTTEVADRGARGLVVRGGPRGVKTFYRWADAKDAATGEVRRRRVKLGHWPALALADARRLVLDANEARHVETTGGEITVQALAEAYRRDVLGEREPSSAAWSWGIIRTHILTAKPDAKAAPFGEWNARTVRGPDISAVIRAARVERTVEVTDTKGRQVKRRLGGKAAARAALRETKAIFATAVGSGALDMSPAAVLQAKALGLKKTARKRRLSPDEIRALFEVLDLSAILDGTAKEWRLTETVRLGIALLFYVPARSHSLIAARWEEIDLNGARWTIPPAKLKLHKDERAVANAFVMPLPSSAVAILRKLRALAGESPWVLAAARDSKQHINRKALVRALERLQESGRLALGSPFTVHDARRTWRSMASDLGVAFEVAERSLAHVLPGVAETYDRAEMVERRAAAADLVAAALDRIRLGKAATVTSLAARK